MRPLERLTLEGRVLVRASRRCWPWFQGSRGQAPRSAWDSPSSTPAKLPLGTRSCWPFRPFVASAIFQIPDVNASAEPGLAKTMAATVVAFVVGYAVVAWLLRYLRNHSYMPFVIYRVALGVLVLALLWAGVLDT